MNNLYRIFHTFRKIGIILIFLVLPVCNIFANQQSSGVNHNFRHYHNYHQSQEFSNLATRLPEARILSDIPVPVDVIHQAQIESTGETQLGLVLQKLIPSFNFSISQLSDGTDQITPATLRGMGPDQLLVLINGKRRHNSALIHVNSSVGRGTSGIDINAIPVGAIKRIELLRDGAAAQYGSDAIAGVINIVLKDATEPVSFTSSYGLTEKEDGNARVSFVNKGFNLNDKGFLYLTFEQKSLAATNRTGIDGRQQYNLIDENFYDPREFSFNRRNHRLGDIETDQHALVGNFGFDLTEATSLYGFLTYSQRSGISPGFYRRAIDTQLNPPTESSNPNSLPQYPDGFLPKLKMGIEDYSIAMGLKGHLNQWDWDSNLHYGSNYLDFFVMDSLNASHVSVFGYSPTSVNSGSLFLSLFTYNLDWVKQTDNKSISAFGFEYKENRFKQNPGEPLSYIDYDGGEQGSSIGGIQVLPGFNQDSQVDQSRESYSVYYDLEWAQTDKLRINMALRHEKYSDFGQTLNGKLAFQFDFHEKFSLRASTNTGFRAPSMQQLYFSSVSTQLSSAGTLITRNTFNNDSDLVNAIGIGDLTEEKSNNLALGFVIKPWYSLEITADFYQITVTDRIVLSGSVEMDEDFLNTITDEKLKDELKAITSAQFFSNAADTRTRGFHLSTNYYHKTLAGQQWTLSAGYHSSRTDILDFNILGNLADVPSISNDLLTEEGRSVLEQWQPQDQFVLSTNYQKNHFSTTLRLNRYGKYTIKDGCSNGSNSCLSQTFSSKWLTDIQLLFQMEENLDVTVGINNVFGVKPDENELFLFGGGPETVVEDAIHVGQFVPTQGIFQYSRRANPFPFNGVYYYFGFKYLF